MKALIPIAIAAVVIGVRLWLRARRRDQHDRQDTAPAATASPGAQAGSVPALGAPGGLLGGVGLVAAREIRERVRGRVFRVGTAVILLVVGAAVVIPTIHGGTPKPVHVGVVGTLPPQATSALTALGTAAGTTVHVTEVPSQAEADQQLRSGTLDVAIVDGTRIVVDKPIDPSDTSDKARYVDVLSTELGRQQAFDAAGLTPAQQQMVRQAKPAEVHALQPAGTNMTRGTSVIGVILIFVMLTQYLTWILVGVMEEKASRVVEVLLAALRPLELLTGKVLGIGLVAMGQAAVIVAFALVLARAVGSNLLHGTGPTEIAAALVWLVLGYAFYCWVYAAAGSTAERQEQIQSLAFPLSLPLLVGYIASLTTAGSGSVSTFERVLAYLPPTAPFAVPVLVGMKAITWWGFLLSAAITVTSTVLLARFAAAVYRRSILRTGGRVRLREALAGRER
jgi:ABC-2 type transport system permease protein